MSTLTKILIVLLTISSIFLCGIVVTYVGTATDYKKEFDSRKSTIDSLRLENANLKDQINSTIEKKDQDIATLNGVIESYRKDIEQKSLELSKYEIDLKDAKTRIENNAEILAANTKTVEMNNQLRKDAEAKVAQLEQLKTKNENEIQELYATLTSKNAVIDQYEVDKKQLVEEKTQLQNQLDKYLQQLGKTSGMTTPITASTGPATMTPPVRALDLAGKINEVKLNDRLASISIGSASGVMDGMKFHVLRDNKFICDIVIFQADADQASGYFDLVGENQPRAGDIVKTNF